MIFDKQNQFSAGKLAAEFTRTAGTSILGDVIDLWGGNAAQGSPLPQGVNGPIGGPGVALIGRLDEIEVYVQCTEAFVSGGTGTVIFQLVGKAADATLTAGATILSATQSVTADAAGANLPAGTILKLTGDIGKIDGLRYLGILVIVGTATMTAGMVAAGIVRDGQSLYG